MAEKELTIFLILVNVVLLIFVGGILAFIVLYRQRKIQYIRETQLLQQLHQQELIETQLAIQQQTMRDIGREIHDDVGQKLTLASIYTQGLLHSKTIKSDVFFSQISEIAKLIDTSLQDLRQLSKSLVQPELTHTSLEDLLRQEVVQFNQLGSCHVHLSLPSAPLLLDTSIKNNIFRTSQEFMQNSLKHASCQNIWISIYIKPNRLDFVFKDDGKGFEIDMQSTGIGLSNVKRRLSELTAFDESFVSILGSGTTLQFSIPFLNIPDETHSSNCG
ncbi:sensor histidine kinase [Runella sp. SP2]|uniref:sensor histidine kinase n=1 Tax=Runella sp. SP2 TaxID=2268026 RepID=UPI000F073A3C|nr:histidine kinase [Runella sp. SP2]AYQ31883.1 two-component sensor histidine kinase [Runella sp. SP2]